jgi:hypothetical protein
VENLSDTLDTWRQDLPSNLRLVSVLFQNSGITLTDTRNIMVIHVLYIGSRLIAYQRKLQELGVGGALRIPENALNTYVGFSRQISRIISFTFQDGHFVRCWLVMWVKAPILE